VQCSPLKYSRQQLIALPPSLSRLSGQCGILDVSQPYRLPRSVMAIDFLFTFSLLQMVSPRASPTACPRRSRRPHIQSRGVSCHPACCGERHRKVGVCGQQHSRRGTYGRHPTRHVASERRHTAVGTAYCGCRWQSDTHLPRQWNVILPSCHADLA
jgi:hypothetical protein